MKKVKFKLERFGNEVRISLLKGDEKDIYPKEIQHLAVWDISEDNSVMCTFDIDEKYLQD